MSETPGNLVREKIAQFAESIGGDPGEWADGWDDAMRHVCKELENLTSKIEGWELSNGH